MATYNVAIQNWNTPGPGANAVFAILPGLVPQGHHEAVISGTAGAKAISVWVTEYAVGQNVPFYGGAVIVTKSVQLRHENGTCRVVFDQPYNAQIGIGLQIIIG